jgi:hypothetical protein
MPQNFDQFYTIPSVAKQCFEDFKKNTEISGDVIYVEPSAGTGSFFKLLPENSRIGLDIEPKYPGIIHRDFFNYEYVRKTSETVVVIGNPPFGKVSSLAIKFFNHSAKFSDYICFIIPRTFKRTSIVNRLCGSFHLLYSVDLPEKGCFEPDISAKCCFQIWKKQSSIRNKIILPIICDDFAFVKYGEKDAAGQPTAPRNADFAIKAFGSNCGEIFTENLVNLRPKSYHFIKANVSVNTQNLINTLKSLDYSISEDTVRQNSLGKADLIAIYLAGKK